MISFDINEEMIQDILSNTEINNEDSINNQKIENLKYDIDINSDVNLDLISYLESEFRKVNKYDIYRKVSPREVTQFFNQNCPEIYYLEEKISEEFFEFSTIYKLPNNRFVKLFRCHEFNSNGFINEDLFKYMKHSRYVEVVPIDLIEDIYEEQSPYLEKFKLLDFLENLVKINFPDQKITDELLIKVFHQLPLMENSNIKINNDEVTYDSVHEIPEKDIFVKIHHCLKVNDNTGKFEENPIEQIRNDNFKEVIQKKKLIISYKEL